MANTRNLRRRIKSIKNTSQITKAMQMVSATKMRRAQNQALSGRPYNMTLLGVLKLMSESLNPSTHPLFLPNGSSNTAVILISSDKGLCGALNTNLFRTITASDQFNQDTIFYTVGKKGRDFIVRTGRSLGADFENSEHLTFSDATKIRKFVLNAFENKEIGQAYLLFPDFISTLRQSPKIVKILPIDELPQEIISENIPEIQSISEFLFEPSQSSILDWALVHFIDTQIYQALLETKASEHSARMMAMQNATDNAKELVEDLTLTYNQVRQDAITNELLEIVSAGAALE